MRETAFLLAGAIGLLGAIATPAAVTTVHAAAADELQQARALIEDARPWVKQADNTDNSNADRKKGRREAYKRLKEARRLYDAHLDANPSQMEELDSEYCECASMIYWIKKMASINEFDSRDEEPVELPKVETAKETPAGGSGIGGTSRPGEDEEDEPPAGGDDPPKDEVEEPVAPPPVDPAEELARRARETLAAIEAEERATPGDVPRLHTLYEKFLVEFPDPSLPEYTTAALRLGALTDRMKNVFKETVGSDPDALKNADSAEITKVVSTLGRLMRSKDPEERKKAARLLGSCGSGSASIYLVRGIRDKDDEVRKLAGEALVAIGGTRVAKNLVKTYRDSKHEAQVSAIEVLERIAQKSNVDALTMSFHIGRFVLSRDQKVAGRALDFLEGLGPAGGPGLLEGLDSRMVMKKVAVLTALGRAKYLEGAPRVGLFLLPGDSAKTVTLRKAAVESLKSMGKPAIPYLVPTLKDRRVKMWTAHTMREIAGVQLSSNAVKKWRKWCEDNGYTKED